MVLEKKKSILYVIALWIVYYIILHDVNLINIFLQLTFFFFLQILHTRSMLLLHEFQGIANS